jgi:serine protease Do
MMKRNRLAASAIALAVAAAFAAGCTEAKLPGVSDANAMSATPAVVSETQAPSAAMRHGLPDFSALVKAQGPAVVNVTVKKNAPEMAAGMPQFDENGPFGEFFRRFGIPVPPGAGEQGEPGVPHAMQGVGSGFIISPDGLILTNAHVVDGADEVTVRLSDKREFTAKVLGADARSDVAVIKIDATGLPAVRIGDPKKAEVGEWVAAIGSPFGLESTVTAGIISAKSRNLPDERLVPFIQTDVAVNPGNSGGPLFNLDGEVVGINSMIYSRTGGYMGVSFAIPIDVAMKVKDDLVKYGKVTRGRIGVVIQSVTPPLAESFGLAKAEGALVSKVEPDSPAAKAGLKTGDVILAWNGQSISDSADLPPRVADTKPGAQASIKVWRDGSEKQLTIAVGEMPADQATLASAAVSASQGKLGVAVRPLAEAEAKQAGTDGGLLVERAQGAAAKAGVRRGDVILGVNGKPVRTPDELKRAIDGAGKQAALLVQRGEARIFVPVQMG